MSRRKFANRGWALACGLLAMSLASGCVMRDEFNDPAVVNYTGAPVTLSYVHNGQTIPMSITVDKGVTSLSTFRFDCSDGALLALDASGSLVARREAPLCPGDTWVIGTRPTVPS